LQGRPKSASVLATVALTLAVPAISTAGPRDQLERTRGRLQSVRNRLERHEHRARSLKARIRELNRDITVTQIALNELDTHIASVRSEVRSAEARIAEIRTEIDTLEEAATQQAVDLYKAGSSHTLSALLEARSIGELNDRIEMLDVAALDSAEHLVRYGRLRIAIRDQHRILFDKKDKLTSARAIQRDALVRRSALRAQLSRALEQLDRTIGRERNREGHLERSAAELKDKIVAAQARSSVMTLGTSATGFIWPLNGPLTSPFGPRWGSTHTGIDIDGYTGQPVVAAKDGRSIYVGAGMSGYGNAVVVDHGGGVATLYAHLSGYEVSSGSYVGQGEIVGYVGCTGNCYGDHLHFEVRVSGQPVNPLDYLP
jgi:murein DD-endopeptidase MepM/ murein hydrolase activator NlpD